MPRQKTARRKWLRRKRSGLGGGRGARGPSGRGMQVPGRRFSRRHGPALSPARRETAAAERKRPRRGGKRPRQNEKDPGAGETAAGETAAAGNGAEENSRGGGGGRSAKEKSRQNSEDKAGRGKGKGKTNGAPGGGSVCCMGIPIRGSGSWSSSRRLRG